MLLNNKFFFYLRHMVFMSFSNKVRLLLTALGIFIAVFLFSLGVIISDSYYAGILKDIEEMSDNTVIFSSYDNSGALKKEIAEYSNKVPIDVICLEQKKSIYSVKISPKQYLNVMAKVTGISNMEKNVFKGADNEKIIPVEYKLVKGREISSKDVNLKAPVAVIDEFTESLLFPDGDAVGNKIKLGSGINGTTSVKEGSSNNIIEVEVIGVVADSHESEVKKLQFEDELNHDENIFVNILLHIPSTALQELYPEEPVKRYFVYGFEQEEYKDFAEYAYNFVKMKTERGNSCSVYTKEELLEKSKLERADTRTAINVITFILCIISGISIMSVIFFSVKERIPEIGIRKAFGAGRLDIAFQFMVEMVIIAFVASFLAVFTSLIFSKIIQVYIRENMFIYYVVKVEISRLILPIAVGIMEAMICSLIPGIYAAGIKVADSLRFE